MKRINQILIVTIAVAFLLSMNLFVVQAKKGKHIGDKRYEATLTGDITGKLEMCGNIRAGPPTYGWGTLDFGGPLIDTDYEGEHWGILNLMKDHFSFGWKTHPTDTSQWYYLKGDVTSFSWDKGTRIYSLTVEGELFIITTHSKYPDPIWSEFLTFEISLVEI